MNDDDANPDEARVDEIVARLGLSDVVETEATSDEHAANVAALISDAEAHMARFEDTRDAT